MEWEDMTLENVRRRLREFMQERLSQNPCSQEYVDRLVARVIVETAVAGNAQTGSAGRTRIIR